MRLAKLSFSILLVLLATSTTAADDAWTQWGGADRDFRVVLNRPLDALSIEESWRRPLGAGYSSILFEDNRLYTMLRNADDEHVVCLAANNGETIWEYQYAAPMSEKAATEFGKGPNATPLIVGQSLITIGFNSDVHCLNKNNGEVIWKKNLITDLGGTVVDLGYSPSPIHYQDNIILPLGGENQAFVALKVSDGSVAWSAQNYKNSYATPVFAPVDGLDQLVFVMTDEVVSIDPQNGKQFWKIPLINQWNTHAFVPVWDPSKNILFVSSFRQSLGLKLERNGDEITPKKLWHNKSKGIGFTNAVRIDDVIYGSTGSSRSSLVTAVNVKTGETLWKERGFAVSNYLSIGDRIILLDEKGTLALARPTGDGLAVIGKQKILSAEKVWTVPTMVGDTIYARDQKEIIALRLK